MMFGLLMANPEHVSLLRESVEKWNRWRDEDTAVPDLIEAHLFQTDLAKANLRRADLTLVNLTSANLTDASLVKAGPAGC